MRGQLRFAMHPDDEKVVVRELLADPSVYLVDGPRWKGPAPETFRDLDAVGSYCIVWSSHDLKQLDADFIPSCGDWYCRSEHSTIQFLRSSLRGNVLTDGRFAVATDGAATRAAASIERRFKALRRRLKKAFLNSVVEWANVQRPRAPAGQARSPNPSKPDSSLWVGPAAIEWLLADASRCIQITPGSPVEGRIAASRRRG